jgi:hypothetical protein
LAVPRLSIMLLQFVGTNPNKNFIYNTSIYITMRYIVGEGFACAACVAERLPLRC